MATQVYTDTLELEIGILEAEPLDPSGGPVHHSSFPYPVLRHTAARRTVDMPVAVLENHLVKAYVAPTLGGRLLKIVDLRTGIDALSCSRVLDPVPGGPRGYHLPDGLQVHVGDGYRPNAMGPVDTSIEEPGHEGEPGSVWFAEQVLGTSLSFHARYTLPADSACIELEVRTLNRSLRTQAYSAWVDALVPGQAVYGAESVLAYDATKRAGLALFGDPLLFDLATYRAESLMMSRFAAGVSEWLGPRQLDCWAMRIVPVTGLESVEAVSAGAALCMGQGAFHVQAVRPIADAKVLVLCEGGRTVEAKVDLADTSKASVATDGLPGVPRVVVLKDGGGEEVLRWEQNGGQDPDFRNPGGAGSGTMAALRQAEAGRPLSPSRERSYFEGLDLMEGGGDCVGGISRALSVPALKAASRVALGMAELRAGRMLEAAARFEDALSFNAEDHLCWWLKAHADRLAGVDAVDRPELPNAHYLAPLEPALRAEAFLSTPIQPDPEPTALLEPIADDVEAWVEPACQLLAAGLYEECSRWLDEGLRHREQPRLRYLAAYICVCTDRMAAEAAHHLAVVAAAPVGPPYPWQALEIRALRALVKRFPGEERPARVLQLVSNFNRG
jgi:hypothetical protein